MGCEKSWKIYRRGLSERDNTQLPRVENYSQQAEKRSHRFDRYPQMNHSRINPSNLCNPCDKKISENIHTESVQEYLDMDKITLVKMLLATQEENRKLNDKLDKISEEAKEREAKAEARNEELMNSNRRPFEY